MLTFQPVALTYLTGEEVQAGDHVLFHLEASQIEFVANRDDPETAWYVEQIGGGCIILAPSFGRAFVRESDREEFEDLEFVSRSSELSLH